MKTKNLWSKLTALILGFSVILTWLTGCGGDTSSIKDMVLKIDPSRTLGQAVADNPYIKDVKWSSSKTQSGYQSVKLSFFKKQPVQKALKIKYAYDPSKEAECYYYSNNCEYVIEWIINPENGEILNTITSVNITRENIDKNMKEVGIPKEIRDTILHFKEHGMMWVEKQTGDSYLKILKFIYDPN